MCKITVQQIRYHKMLIVDAEPNYLYHKHLFLHPQEHILYFIKTFGNGKSHSILLKQRYDYTGYILVFDKWFPLQDENSQEL